MARIQRYNVVLDVDDSEVGYYTNLGYNVIDMKGNVIQKAKSTDVHTLQQEISDYEKKVAELNSEITRLNKVIEELKKPATTDEPRTVGRKKKGAE